MKNKLGFTLIELIVTISILTIISSSGVYYFFSFTSSQNIKIETQAILDNIKSLNYQIQNKNLLDYRATFNTMTGNLLYTIETNFSHTQFSSYISFLENSGSGVINIKNGSGADIWNLKIYNGKKLQYSEILQADKQYDFILSENTHYQFRSYINGIPTNNLFLNYYSHENLTNKIDGLVLSTINTSEDSSGIDIKSLEITNIGGRKIIKGDGVVISQASLFFEKQGQINTLTIKN